MLTLAPGGPHWPEALGAVRGPRLRQLWALGRPELLAGSPSRFVAIVGTREASSYGLRVAKSFGRALAAAGATVVSGMARGIDTAAHEGALEAGGNTIAVLGTGADVPYPVGNRWIHSQVAERGLIISESRPGAPAFRGCFPRRNRIIAALSHATIVVEAGHKSGALNTAAVALEMGRVVAAVPGMIDSMRAAGSNLLLRDGAHPVVSIDDALGLVGLSRDQSPTNLEMHTIEADIWDLLGLGCQLPDVLAERVGASLREVQASIGRLEVRGLVSHLDDGSVARTEITQPKVVSTNAA